MPNEVPNTATSVSNRSLLSLYGLAFTVPLGVLYMLESLAIKFLQVKDIVGEVSPITLFQAWSPDVSFAIVTTVGLAMLFSWCGRWGRVGVAIPYYTLMTGMLVLNVASYGYFVATGANLSWSVIKYWFINYEEVSAVLSGDDSNNWVRFAVAYGHAGLVLLAAILPNIPPVRRRLDKAFPPRRALIIGGVALVLAAGSAAIPPAEGPAMAVSHCVPLAIATDLIEQELLPEGDVEIADNERLDSSLEFQRRADAPRLNVVLIMFESLNWKSSDAYVPDQDVTPFLAELARDAMLVENHYTVVPHTTKAVVPLNCGIYPYLKTTPKETLPGILPRRCLAHILRSEGYRTAFFQPAGNFEKRDQLVANMGYEVFKGLDDMPQEGFENTNYFGKEEHIMLGPSMEWLDAVRDRGPFLLTYLTLSTHHNYVTPQWFPYHQFPVENVDHRNFLNAARYTDAFLRDLFAEFRKRDLMDNTLFIIVGDHGEAFGEHGGWQHDLVLWEEGLHSFSMLYAPGHLPGGKKIDGFRSHLDIVPTVCDALGLELTKGDFLGTSILREVPADRKQFYSCWFNRRCLAMREGPVKYIYHYGARPMEVYDNLRDPFDLHDLAHSGEYDNDVLKSKEREMIRWVKVVNQQYDEWEKALAKGAMTEEEPPVEHNLSASFGDSIELIGYDLSPKEARAGQDIRIRYVFRALKQMQASSRMFVHVSQGRKFINADHVPANGTHPLEKWIPGKYMVDEHVVHIPGTWKTGQARVLIGFWDKGSGKRFPVNSTDGEVDQNRLVVAEFKVRGGGIQPVVTLEQRRRKIKRWIGYEEPPSATQPDVTFGDKVRLAGLTRSRMDVELAGTVEMTYVFKAMADIPANWKLTVKLVRADGETINGDHVPIGGLYPPGDWREGEYVVDLHRIHIDMNRSKPGSYTVWLGFKQGSKPVDSQSDLETDALQRVNLGTVTIERGAQKKAARGL